MTSEEVLDAVLSMLQRRGRVTYRTLKRQFNEAVLIERAEHLLVSSPCVYTTRQRPITAVDM
jgi:hypothetical protein